MSSEWDENSGGRAGGVSTLVRLPGGHRAEPSMTAPSPFIGLLAIFTVLIGDGLLCLGWRNFVGWGYG